jgi:PAS domain S-box-containing protein
MVAARAHPPTPGLLEKAGSDAELRRCVRDLVALSSLPALWIKADARQIADSIGMLAVSILDADFACVFLRDPEVQSVHSHQSSRQHPIDPAEVRKRFRPNAIFEIDHGAGTLRATCVPLGKEPGSGLVVSSRRQDFPTDTERTLLRVAANQAAIAIERWKSEEKSIEQARVLRRLTDTEKALYIFTDRLFRAESLGEVYDAGLNAIVDVLRCDRASILMFDASSVMRFVAWRNLSGDYRAAAAGHSPWKPEDREAAPLSIDNIEMTSDVPPELNAVVRSEGIAALAFIPIFSGAKLVGKFMAYYDAPHAFSQAELDSGLAISRQLGFGIERLGAEEAARRLATIVDSSDDAIISKNLDGVIQTWNRGAERMFGYTMEQVVGKPVTILMPPDRYDEEPGILARLRAGERIESYQTVRRRKDGNLLDVSLTVSPIRDASGHVIGASKIARDVTEQKRAEAAVRDNERRLQELLSAIPAAIYTTDATGKLTYYNEAAVEFAGRRPVLGSDEWCVSLKLYWPDGTPLPHDQCPMAVALKENRPVRGKEAVAERPDGTRIPFIPFPTPLHDADGKLVGAINMLIDVSERKQAEAQQHVLMRELNHRVKNNMQMLQSLLFTASRQTQNTEARDVLNDVSRRIAAMSAAQGTLYSSRSADKFSSIQFVQAVCTAAEQSFPPNVKIDQKVALCELDNDHAMPLALILNELLTNAVKYGSSGGNGATIRVGFNKEDGFELYVEDDGPGFDFDEVKDRSSGLKLVQLLARQLRGQLYVNTERATRCAIRFK